MIRVASYAFFRDENSAYEQPRAGAGRGRFFVNFLPAVARAHRSVFPEWELWIHHDERVREYPYFAVLERMATRGLLRLFPMGASLGLCRSMLWRMGPIWSANVEYVMCRDIDSLPTPRERKSVSKWMGSGEAIHAMHDSISHRGTLLMGGLVDFDAQEIRRTMAHKQFTALVDQFDFSFGLKLHGSDQVFLNRHFAPRYSILSDDGSTLPEREDPRDFLTNHLGAAYHTQPVITWYDANSPDQEILECEKEPS